MKAALLVLVCLGAARPAAAHIDILAALHKGVPTHKKFDILSLLHGGHKKKPQEQDPTGILSRVMAAASQSLSFAEKQHEKAVQAARGELEVLLTKQGSALTKAIQQYNTSLVNSMTVLSSNIESSNKVLEKAEKESSADSWNSKTGHAQAVLKAQVSFVQREVRKKAQRKHAANLRQAVSDADMLLENGVTKLSRKVGDISDMIKKAQTDVEDGAALEASSSKVALVQTNVDLDKATAALRAANQQIAESDEAGSKRMKANLDQIEKDLEAGAKAIADKLEASQEEELKGVRSATATNAFTKPKPALRKMKKHA